MPAPGPVGWSAEEHLSPALARLLTRLALAATDAADPTEVLELALHEVCGLTGWPVGHAYLWNEERRALLPSSVWHLDDPERFAPFREATDRKVFAPGEGLPGRVATSERPHWITAVTADSNFPRASNAEAAGLGAAFAFPVRAGESVAAVLEFYSTEVVEPDEPLLAMLATVGSQLGRVFERVDATAALREREERFRALVDNVSDAVVVIDADSTIVFANRALRETLGYEPDELVGSRLTELMPERFRGRHLTGVSRYVERGERTLEWQGLEFPGLHRNGSEVPLEISFGEYDQRGRHYFIGIMRDVSDRVRAEEERERALKSRRRLLRGFAHDIKNPIGAADGALALLADELSGGLSDRQHEHVERARRSLEDATELIERLLDLVRAEAGQLELELRDTDPVALVTELVREFHARAEAKELDLSVCEGDPPATVRTDPTRVRQVVRNLLSNAVKYTPRGGSVAVSIGAAELRSGSRGTGVEITVADTGPGIPPEERDRLFEEFSRFGSGAEEGLGIGLAISREIALALGGDLLLAPDRAEGAAFAFRLPAALSGAS